MFFEHWIYSAALAIIIGMVYHKVTGRDYAWIIIASAYVPDVDIIANAVLKKVGITVLIYGSPIRHGNFHNLAVLLLFATAVAFLLHPMGIKLMDSFFFAGIGFGAHLFEDALVYDLGYLLLWPFSVRRFGIGIFNYSRDWYGVADTEVLLVGLILVLVAVILRTAYEGTDWLKRSMGFSLSLRANAR
ncbi:MAG: metal-dependent hydrolase [Methanophagales archaeon ANME-1-THS]|nr:MAG: metal-dependent hydrolase [Methanophagales archaeon ANME-1-THS]